VRRHEVVDSLPFLGALAGPLLGFVFAYARVGPLGLLWFEGKGGETILTPVGRIVDSIVFFVGAIAGIACGWVCREMYQRRHQSAEPKDGNEGTIVSC
jgi:hypothetical protein